MLADDRTSSATVLFSAAAQFLREARGRGRDELREAAAAVCASQPSMGALWNLAAVALGTHQAPFERLIAKARRAPEATARYASGLLGGTARRVLTCSRSAFVEACVRALEVPVICAESRPGLEGRSLAETLARDGRPVTVASDAAIAWDLRDGDVVIVGADTVGADWFVNKTGTAMLCAAAQLAGIPAYVVAGREKFVSAALAPLIRLREDDPATLWADPPPGVRVINPLFERVPVERVSGLITDEGLLAGRMVGDVCESVIPQAAVRALVDLLAQD